MPISTRKLKKVKLFDENFSKANLSKEKVVMRLQTSLKRFLLKLKKTFLGNLK